MAAPNKKPTMMQVKNAISNLINELGVLTEHTKRLDTVLFDYLRFKKDEDKFKSWLEKEYAEKKESKDE